MPFEQLDGKNRGRFPAGGVRVLLSRLNAKIRNTELPKFTYMNLDNSYFLLLSTERRKESLQDYRKNLTDSIIAVT